MDFILSDIWDATPIPGMNDLTIYRIIVDLLVLTLIFVAARLAVWFVQKFIDRRLNYFTEIDEGKKFAIKQISKYLIYAVAIAIVFDKLHIGSIVLTSFAGLFVGLGFGIQQTFNDLTSGLILLFEGSVRVGDIIYLDDQMGKVTSIGVRYSVVQTRDDITIIVPNSKLIVDKVTNLSGNTQLTRFNITVGVIYGSDVALVKAKLIEAVRGHERVNLPLELNKKEARAYKQDSRLPDKFVNHSQVEEPRVYFQDFGDNSLVFDIFFWTWDIWDVDIVKSDIRFEINEIFNEHGIVIAFPQRDVHIKVDKKELDKIRQKFGGGDQV